MRSPHTGLVDGGGDQLDLVKPAATEGGYFTTNHHRMQYADFRANGYL